MTQFNVRFLILAYCAVMPLCVVSSLAQEAQSARQSVLSEALQHYSSNVPVSEQKIHNALKEKTLKDQHDGQDPSEKEWSGETEIPDSDALLYQEGEDDVSPYAMLLQRRPIHPDQMLSRLKPFGYNVFSGRTPSTYAPTAGVAILSEYAIGSGDEIIIMLYGRINEEHRLEVDRNGAINIPRLGPVSVAGLSFTAMVRYLTTRLGSIEGVDVSVTLGKLRTIGVYVVGEVRKPGLYTVSALNNVTNVLIASGGPTTRGSLRNIELRRNGRLVTKIDFYDFLLKGNDDSKYKLQSGDVILVPVASKKAIIAGNVRRSAIYELEPKSSLEDVIRLAGGFTPTAWTARIQIERFIDHSFQTVLDLDSFSGTVPEFDINDGDIIKIYPVLQIERDGIYLRGNVLRPGLYQHKEGMRASDLIDGFDNLLPETYFTYAVVMRPNPKTSTESILPFNLGNALSLPGGPDDLLLVPYDRIMIYHRDFFEPDRSVSIDGAVTTPGRYKLLDNMKIRDLILQAGGLRDNASSQRGELYRRMITDEEVVTSKREFHVFSAMHDDPAHNFELERFDRVYIRRLMGWEEQQIVELRGEFVYPGRYVIFEGETLEELIQRAGGFTAAAYLDAAILSRPSVKRLEQERIDDYTRQLRLDMAQATTAMASAEGRTQAITLILEQQNRLVEELAMVEPLGRVVIDMTTLEGYRDFLLEHGDIVTVPRNTHIVSVIGEVYNPASFRHDQRNGEVGAYIALSGGTKREADKRSIYVVRANGSVLTGSPRAVLRTQTSPGDVIIVPQRVVLGSPYASFMRTLETVEKLVTISAATTQVMVNYRLLSN